MSLQQTASLLLSELDLGAVLVGAALLAALVTVLVAVGLAGSRPPAPAAAALPGAALPVRPARRSLRRRGRRCGLTTDERTVLEHLLRIGHDRLAAAVFTNHGLLDGILLRGIELLQHDPTLQPDARSDRLALLLSIKARIESAGERAIPSSSSPHAGTRLTVVPALGGGFPARVLAGVGSHFACAVPRDETGDEVHWRRGARIKVTGRAGAGGTRMTRVVGYGLVGDRRALLLSDTRTLPGPRHRPRLPDQGGGGRRCTAFPIESRGARPDRPRASVLSDLGSVCTLLALTAGGARLRGRARIVAGNLIMLIVPRPQAPDAALFGKVASAGARTPAGMFDVVLTRRSRERVPALTA